MGTANRAFVAALPALALALVPARAQETVHAPRTGADLAQRACLNQKERRTLVENGRCCASPPLCTSSEAVCRGP